MEHFGLHLIDCIKRLDSYMVFIVHRDCFKKLKRPTKQCRGLEHQNKYMGWCKQERNIQVCLLLGATYHNCNPCVALVSPWSQSLTISHCYSNAYPLYLQDAVDGNFCSGHYQRFMGSTASESHLYTLSWSYNTADLCRFCSVYRHWLTVGYVVRFDVMNKTCLLSLKQNLVMFWDKSMPPLCCSWTWNKIVSLYLNFVNRRRVTKSLDSTASVGPMTMRMEQR